MKSFVLYFSLSASTLLGSSLCYASPMGPSVSIGVNPVVSVAGTMDISSVTSVADILIAPVDQDLIITDIILGMTIQGGDYYSGNVILSGSDGIDYGVYSLGSGTKDGTSSRDLGGRSGLHIPAGVSITIEWQQTYSYGNIPDLSYTISGYLARP
jgi:hypothetical protein